MADHCLFRMAKISKSPHGEDEFAEMCGYQYAFRFIQSFRRRRTMRMEAPSCLLAHQNASALGEAGDAVGVDTPEDLAAAEARLEELER